MRISFLFSLLFVFISCHEKERYHFQVSGNGPIPNSVPVFLELSEVPKAWDDDYVLLNKGTLVSYQLDQTRSKLWFIHRPENAISYTLEKKGDKPLDDQLLTAEKVDGNLELALAGNPLVQYRYEMTYPPQGVDSLYKKSGYLHPVITLKGDTLTRIQPPDHYHHYGIWGPWTHTQVNGQRVDFWNLGEGMGTVLFKEFKETVSGNVHTSFMAVQEHIDLKTAHTPQVALNEDLRVQLWNLARPDRYILDYSSFFSSPLESGILFEAYRYGGGLGFRFHERWDKDNSTVLTSEGKDRLTADGTEARWCIVQGESSHGGNHGVLFMSHPDNRTHPEPMRVWPMDANGGRGDMFFEFCPIRQEEWKIEPGRNYALHYRMIVFDGELTTKEAEAYWQAFASPPQLQIHKD